MVCTYPLEYQVGVIPGEANIYSTKIIFFTSITQLLEIKQITVCTHTYPDNILARATYEY